MARQIWQICYSTIGDRGEHASPSDNLAALLPESLSLDSLPPDQKPSRRRNRPRRGSKLNAPLDTPPQNPVQSAREQPNATSSQRNQPRGKRPGGTKESKAPRTSMVRKASEQRPNTELIWIEPQKRSRSRAIKRSEGTKPGLNKYCAEMHLKCPKLMLVSYRQYCDADSKPFLNSASSLVKHIPTACQSETYLQENYMQARLISLRVKMWKSICTCCRKSEAWCKACKQNQGFLWSKTFPQRPHVHHYEATAPPTAKKQSQNKPATCCKENKVPVIKDCITGLEGPSEQKAGPKSNVNQAQDAYLPGHFESFHRGPYKKLASNTRTGNRVLEQEGRSISIAQILPIAGLLLMSLFILGYHRWCLVDLQVARRQAVIEVSAQQLN